jgi:serine/threonine-protein kinase
MPTAVAPGMTIDRYRVDAEIGAGSMGDVYMAIDVELGRKVALKILSERHRDNEELRARFVREARAVAAIAHPNVVQVFTTGSFDDRPFIAMEFLDGVDLGSDVKENGPWSSLQATRALLDAARGLDGAARAGLIHRDVKPSNLVLLRDGSVKVTDFGLAKPLDPGDEPALTAMGVVVGTPDYIAPEQARGDPIDERVDIYALGGTLYFLVTGMPPFRTGRKQDDKYLKVVARHLRQPAPDPRKRNANVDDELAELGIRLMAKKPVGRPGYAELIEQLGAIVDRLAAVDRTGARAPTSSGSSGTVEPTPFVGGAGPKPRDFDFGKTLDSTGVPAADPLDNAQTNVRMPTAPPVPGPLPDTQPVHADDIEVSRPKTSRWLVAVTILSVLIFLTGLALLLFGPMPEQTAAAASPAAGDGGAPVVDAPAAVSLDPPDGMVLVRRPTGEPWLFVATRAVSWTDYQSVFPRHDKPSRRIGDDAPVTGVSYDHAVSFAEARGSRLPTSEEWDAAAATTGFEPADKRLWEWVAAPDGGPAETRPVRSTSSAKPEATREPNGHRDVTFRLARDLGR